MAKNETFGEGSVFGVDHSELNYCQSLPLVCWLEPVMGLLLIWSLVRVRSPIEMNY